MTTESTRGIALATGHVGLNVSDAERSKHFYRQVFGFEVMVESEAQGRRFVFLGDGESLILTLWEQSAGRFETGRPGLHHLSFEVSSIEEVRTFEARGCERWGLLCSMMESCPTPRTRIPAGCSSRIRTAFAWRSTRPLESAGTRRRAGRLPLAAFSSSAPPRRRAAGGEDVSKASLR